MQVVIAGAAAAMAVIALCGIAGAAPCEQALTAYPPPPDYSVTLTCSCGPPQGGLLDLSELNQALDPNAPEPFAGTLMQQIGGVVGSWTYADTSNICFAAQHAGLIPDPDFGAEITLSVSPGCTAYEGSVHNGITTVDGGPRELSFYFADVSDGACPGAYGYLPERVSLGRFADGWTAITYAKADGSWTCLAYAPATGTRPDDAELWLYALANQIRFAPDTPIAAGSRLALTIDGFTMPMGLRNGYGYVPTSIAAMARRLGTGRNLAVTVTPAGRGTPQIHFFPLAGFADAYRRIAQECGFDPSAVLGDDD